MLSVIIRNYGHVLLYIAAAIFVLEGSNLFAALFFLTAITIHAINIQAQKAEDHKLDDEHSDNGEENELGDSPDLEEPSTFRRKDAYPEWEVMHVFPSRMQYERCYAYELLHDYGLWEYTIKEKWVFVRLLDCRKENWDVSGERPPGTARVEWEVVNGTVLRDAITARYKYQEDVLKRVLLSSSKDEHLKTISHYEKQAQWHELVGAERYFILSKHSLPKWKFEEERERLQTAFAHIDSKAKALNAIRNPKEYGDYYVPQNDADDATKQAIAELQSNENLTQLGISEWELYDQELILKTLDKIILEQSESEQQATNGHAANPSVSRLIVKKKCRLSARN